jgi:hypothetical protein
MSDFARLQELARDAGLAINPPSLLTAPIVSPDTAVVGGILSCTTGTWGGFPTSYAYEWRHLDDPAVIGTGATYTTVSGDAGTNVRCVVTATNGAGSTTADPSNPVPVTATAAAAQQTTATTTGESRRK